MAKINLLPWRQALRAQKKREFIVVNVGVAAIAAGLVFFAHIALSEQVSDQQERNTYIKSEIAKLDTQIKEIDELQKRRDELMSRMKIIQDLQGRRPVVVRVFDEFVRTLPDGVYFKNLERVGDTFKISGVAESKNEVSQLMRNLDASPWFKNPQLSNVVEDASKAAPAGAGAPGSPQKATTSVPSESNQFTLTVQLEIPTDPSTIKTASTDASGTPAAPMASAAVGQTMSAAPAPAAASAPVAAPSAGKSNGTLGGGAPK